MSGAIDTLKTDARRIGILAGGGSLPREIAECAARRGHAVSIVAIDGEADQDFAPFPVTHANWAQIGRMLGALKAAGTEDLVIAGRVKRPDVLALRPDVGFFRAIAEIAGILASGGDDGVLRAVVRFFEGKGLRVIGVAEAAPELVIGAGLLGSPVGAAAPVPSDIALGFAVIRALGRHDIGQAAVISGNRVEAIEAAEGTDGMLRRVAERRGAAAASRCGVLVKRPKPGQELRVDLPAIGPGTAQLALAAGLAGIAVEAGQVIAVDRAGLLAEISRSGLFVLGTVDRDAVLSGVSRAGIKREPLSFQAAGARAMKPRGQADAARGADVLDSVAAVANSAGVVVARGYVLAVETGEGLSAMLTRAAGLRQWGTQRWGRRQGVVVLARGADLDDAVIASAAAAGLEGVVVVGSVPDASAHMTVLARAADRAGLFLAAAENASAPVSGAVS